jgi:hypothetical protein
MRRINNPDFSAKAWRAAPEMTPREFLDRVVQPNLDQLRADPGDLRHAHNAVLTTDALMGYVYQRLIQIRPAVLPSGCTSDARYRAALAGRDRACHVHRDLAAALKHGHLDSRKRHVRSAGAMGRRGTGFPPGLFREQCAPAQGDTDFIVIVHTNDDEGPTSALELVAHTVKVLDAELKKYGL